ncbi:MULTISPECIES: type VII secretion protein EssA [Allobacillus]|nr:type VII secretion protein EssA [Allobacillus salarius]
MSLKSFRKIVLLSCFLILLWPHVATADNQDDKGKIDWKIDRISESNRNKSNIETELDRSFPELFKSKTTQQISLIQNKQKQSIDQLRQELFSIELSENAMIENTKEQLFPENYVAPKTTKDFNSNNALTTKPMTIVFLFAIACFLSGFVYYLFRRFADRGDTHER